MSHTQELEGGKKIFCPRGQTFNLNLICIHKALCPCLRLPHFICSPGQTFFTHNGVYKHFSHTGGGDKHTMGYKHLKQGEGQTFFVGCGGGYDDVDELMNVSEANIVLSEASKLSAGARIFRGP